MIKPGDLRDQSPEELADRVRSLEEELFNLKFQHGTNQLENPMRVKQTKRDIARVKTVIREKQRTAAAEA
jgi:large subunit ribosomal protein L29